MLINCKQLWSCEEASDYFRVYSQPKQRRQSFHSLSRIVADLMWDSTSFFVTLLCLRRLHFTRDQVLKCVTEISARARHGSLAQAHPNLAADTSSCMFVAFSCFNKWHKFVKCLLSAQTSVHKYSPMFIPCNRHQNVSQSAVSKPSHDPHDTQTEAHAAPMLRSQMCSGFSLWWNPSPSEGLSSSGLLISGLFTPLNFSMGECDIPSTRWFWRTNMWACVHPGTEVQVKG